MKKNDYSHDELIDRLKAGKMSRRRFNQILGAAGISMVATPLMSGKAMAAAGDQATYFTWGGWDLPELFPDYTAKHGDSPCFAV